MKVRNIISILLIIAIIGLAYVVYSSIMRPVKFDREYNKRSAEVINKLKDLRSLQETYKSTYGKFCGNIDSLILFAEVGKVNTVKKFGTIPDSLTESQALKAGIIKRDTVAVNPLEKLLEEKKFITNPKNISELKYIPFSNNEPFNLKATIVTKSGVEVPTFEITADIFSYTKGMDEQDVVNRKADLEDKNRYPGWKVGDIDQPITDGNWE
ncbi:MAG: hypothetical protein LBM25_07835 [Bacteroidales bacterium]|jgi:hypothetical protein|nr:hypothetical protein [Bacteroidales bacterium]